MKCHVCVFDIEHVQGFSFLSAFACLVGVSLFLLVFIPSFFWRGLQQLVDVIDEVVEINSST